MPTYLVAFLGIYCGRYTYIINKGVIVVANGVVVVTRWTETTYGFETCYRQFYQTFLFTVNCRFIGKEETGNGPFKCNKSIKDIHLLVIFLPSLPNVSDYIPRTEVEL